MQRKLYRDGHRFLLNDDQLASLERLKVPRITPCNDGGVRTTLESLLHDGVTCLPMLGLRHLIANELNAKGHDVQQVSTAPISTLASPAAGSGTSYPSLARFVRTNINGLIEVRSDYDIDVAAIASLARAYPENRIMVVGDRGESLRRILRVLRSKFRLRAHDAIGRSRGQLEEEAPKLVVSTFLGAADFDLAHCDIVIFADAHECAHKRATMMLSQVDARFRVFGLMRGKRYHQQPKNRQGHLLRVFGANSIALRSHNRVRVGCQITWHQNRQNFIDLTIEDADYHRHVIWNNRRRNQKIKQATQEIATDSLNHSVILVKTLQHASALSKRLPDWQVWIAESEKRESQLMNRRFRDKAKSPGTDWLTGKSIVTTACAPRYPGYLAQNIVWAGSGVAPEIPSSWFYRRDDRSRNPVNMVDFTDGFNREASRQARLRNKWYQTNLTQQSFERGSNA